MRKVGALRSKSKLRRLKVNQQATVDVMFRLVVSGVPRVFVVRGIQVYEVSLVSGWLKILPMNIPAIIKAARQGKVEFVRGRFDEVVDPQFQRRCIWNLRYRLRYWWQKRREARARGEYWVTL